MGVIRMIPSRFMVFKQNGNNVEAYINNKLTKKIPLKNFTNFCDVEFRNTIYNFLSAESTCEECNIIGEVVITSTPKDKPDTYITICVGLKTINLTFRDIGHAVFYCDIENGICDFMHTLEYEKLYTKKSIKNLWGLLE